MVLGFQVRGARARATGERAITNTEKPLLDQMICGLRRSLLAELPIELRGRQVPEHKRYASSLGGREES